MFQSDRPGRPAIFTLDLASGRTRQLSGSPGWTEENPRWSPDGAKVAFASNRAHYDGTARDTGAPDMDIWVINADGTGLRRLTTHSAQDTTPTWAPDGQSLVFSSDRDSRGDLFRVWLSDGRTERLTRHYAGRAIMPAFSPDGQKVAFAAQTLRMGAFWDFQVHLFDLASGKTDALASSAGACWPTWSRQGSRMANVLLRRDQPSVLEERDVASNRLRQFGAESPCMELLPGVLARRRARGVLRQPGTPRGRRLGPRRLHAVDRQVGAADKGSGKRPLARLEVGVGRRVGRSPDRERPLGLLKTSGERLAKAHACPGDRESSLLVFPCTSSTERHDD